MFRGTSILLALGLVAAGSGHAQEPAKDKANIHANGEPLPAGALARLGTMRFRHGGGVNYVAFTPDKKAVLTSSQDNVIRLWDRSTGREIRRFEGPVAQNPVVGVPGVGMGGWAGVYTGIGQVALSPDGRLVAAARPGNIVQVWHVDTGKEIRQLKAPGNGVALALVFSPNGKVLAARGGDRSTVLFDTQTGEVLHQIKPVQQGPIRFNVANPGSMQAAGMAFSPDGKTLATAEMEFTPEKIINSIRQIDVQTGKEIRRIDTTPNGIASIAYSPDENYLAFVSANTIHLRAAGSAKEVRKVDTQGAITTLVFAPDSKTFATKGRDQLVRIFDADTGKPIHQLGEELPLPGGNGQAFFGYNVSETRDLAFAPDGKSVATGDGVALRFWDNTGKEVALIGGHRGQVSSLRVSPDGTTMASFGADNRIIHWDTRASTVLGSFRVRQGTSMVAFSPDIKTVALVNTNGSIYLHAVETGKELHQLKGHQYTTSAVTFSPNGKMLASRGMYDNTIRLQDTATGTEIRQIAVQADLPAGGAVGGGGFGVGARGGMGQGLAFSSDGATLAANVHSGFQGAIIRGQPQQAVPGKIHMWDVGTGKELRQITLPAQRMTTQLAFSPDGRLLATDNAGDQTVSLLEIASGKERALLGEPPPEPKQPAGQPARAIYYQPYALTTATDSKFAFSPDGTMLAARGPDSSFRVWDVAHAKEIARLKGHSTTVTAVGFAADGKTFATGSTDTTILVWDATRFTRVGAAPAVALKASEVEAMWDDLLSSDAAKAYKSILTLSHAPKQAVPCLQEHLKPATPVDAKIIDKWIADMDSTNFQTRKRATTELEKLGDLAGPALRKVLQSNPSVELRRRTEPLLEKLATGDLSPEQVRLLRALEVLDKIGAAESRPLLETLARGAPGAFATRQAQAVLDRMPR